MNYFGFTISCQGFKLHMLKKRIAVNIPCGQSIVVQCLMLSISKPIMKWNTLYVPLIINNLTSTK